MTQDFNVEKNLNEGNNHGTKSKIIHYQQRGYNTNTSSTSRYTRVKLEIYIKDTTDKDGYNNPKK